MVGIIEYGAGNLRSLELALGAIGAHFRRVAQPTEAEAFERLILPGVGHARPAMQRLEATGMADLLRNWERPLLGICLGMQLLCEYSEEGDTPLLGRIPLAVRRFRVEPDLKVPHMGWNQVSFTRNSLLTDKIAAPAWFYFVHSYAAQAHPEYTLGSCAYGSDFSAILSVDNCYGAQFHPEKSAEAGLQLLRNFVNIPL
jgi:glutamine amidotransferase